MRTVRQAVFWLHLSAGLVAGLVILIMSATGVVLTYEKQMLAWADRTPAAAPPAGGASRLGVDRLLAVARAAEPSAPITAINVSSQPGAPALVTMGPRIFAVNAYTGVVIGESAPRLRRVFRAVTAWHRWLGVEGPGRTIARAFTGWGNALFLLIVLGGPFLWLPKVWSTTQLRAITVFRGGLRGKARDFNWHNVIGIWSCVPLLVIVLGAMPISFGWANAAVYRLVGEQPPAPGAGRVPGAEGGGPAPSIETAWRRAEAQVADWRTISVRIPTGANAPLAFTIDRGTGGQPQLRGTLTVDRATGDVVKWEAFESQSTGRQLRSIARFAHTGEVLGVVGQTIAGLASAGAVVLVWTGLALALRRCVAWRKRRATLADIARRYAA